MEHPECSDRPDFTRARPTPEHEPLSNELASMTGLQRELCFLTEMTALSI
jgi:hypothetical protein